MWGGSKPYKQLLRGLQEVSTEEEKEAWAVGSSESEAARGSSKAFLEFFIPTADPGSNPSLSIPSISLSVSLIHFDTINLEHTTTSNFFSF